MARRRRKNRTHMPAGTSKNTPKGIQPLNASAKSNAIPKSMVIRIGASEVGPSISQLVLDTRKMMEPHTAIRLKERKSNKLRDYTTMAGPLGITQLLLFSRNAKSGSVTLRIACCPRGPTFHFRVKNYSLCKDIRRSIKRPKTPSKEYMTPPLLVMNNFTSLAPDGVGKDKYRPPPHETLIISMFQSLFPPISAQHTPLKSIRRVLLLNRELKSSEQSGGDSDSSSSSDYAISLRHYTINTKPLGLSRAVRKINAAEKSIMKSSSPVPFEGKSRLRSAVPNLGRLQDISEYVLDPTAAANAGGYTSESEVEEDAEVEVLNEAKANAKHRKKKALNSGPAKHAVKLIEIGPRMNLELVKIEEGMSEGKVLYHAFNTKTREEERELEERWEARKKEKEARKKAQETNVARKKAAVEKDGEAKTGEDEDEADGDKIVDDSNGDEDVEMLDDGDENFEDMDEED